jgi:hypothetical protein
MLLTFAGYLYGGPGTFRLYHGGIDLHNSPDVYSLKPEENLSMRIMEERYQNKNDMLQAVSEGDTKRALQCLSWFRGYSGEQRTENRICNMKNGYIVLNALARKAVENGYVHPEHIHSVSDDQVTRLACRSIPIDL